MVVTDQALYMFSEFFNLKQMCSHMRHVTCIVYALNHICESVRVEYYKTKDFISEMKKILLKGPARIQIYRDVTGLALSPVPIITHWGTWLRATVFYCKNFYKIQLFLSQFSELESETVGKAQRLVKNNDVRNELYAIHFVKVLPDKITKIETRNISKDTQ